MAKKGDKDNRKRKLKGVSYFRAMRMGGEFDDDYMIDGHVSGNATRFMNVTFSIVLVFFLNVHLADV